MLWVGSDASPQLLKDLFDVDDFLHIDATIVRTSRHSHPACTNIYSDRRSSPFSQRGYQSKSATSSTTGTHSGAGRPSCPSRDKTWMAQSSSLRTCSSRTRTMRRCRISTVRASHAV